VSKQAKTGKIRREELGDFTTTWRVLPISALAMGIGVLCAFVALVLLRLIGLFTNLFYFGRWSSAMVSPAGNRLGGFSVLVPIGGALIIGLMARYGSERIRGHGIPEAIEAILMNGSRVEPKVAFLKPLSSAISIGSGGPFGAEGPIIVTGGAFGSMIALPGNTILGDIVNSGRWQQWQAQRLLPVVDAEGRLAGVVTSEDLRKWKDEAKKEVLRRTLGELARANPASVYSDEILRVIVHRMAESGLTRMPVLDRESGKLQGMVTLEAVLKARARHLEDERRREQTLSWRHFAGPGAEASKEDS